MIRAISQDELLLTRDCAYAFFKESGIEGTLDFDHFCNQWSRFIQLDVASILLYFDEQNNPKGIIGGLCTECTMTKDLTAQEVFWWVDPVLRARSPAGIKLLRAWEEWARRKGARRIYVGNLYRLNNDSMISLYHRIGYKPTELHYVKSCENQNL